MASAAEHSAEPDEAKIVSPETILEGYCIHLEQGGAETPDTFLQRFLVSTAFSADQLSELRQSLQSVQIVHNAGRRLQTAVLPGPAFEPGTQLGDFEVLRPIGRGGMGIVFLARQVSLNREVALKILPIGSACAESARARFQLEARASAALSHPNIVPVYAIGNQSGVDYYAMQYVHGTTLQQSILRDLRIPAGGSTASGIDSGVTGSGLETGPAVQNRHPRNSAETVIRWMIRISDALHHAHLAGIVHRDVKPSNILIGEDGKPWLTDFGLAHVEQDVSLTATGAVIGSLRYMSPEQFNPGSGIVDHRTDIYGLGVTLYEALTGKPAVPGNDRREITPRLCNGFDTLDWSHAPEIAEDLRTIVTRTIQPDPADRYSSAAEVTADLTAFLEDRPILARPLHWSDRLFRWARRHRRIVFGTVIGTLFGIAALSIAVWLISDARWRADQSAAKATAAQGRAEQNLNEALTAINTFYRKTSEALEEVPGTVELNEQLMRDAESFFERLADSNAGQSVPLLNLAEAQVTLAALHAQNDRPADALKVADEALTTLQRLRSNESNAPLNFEAHARFALATAHLALGNGTEALKQADACVALVDQIEERQTAHVWQHHLYRWKRGKILMHLQRYDEALTQMRQAVEESRASLQQHPENHRARVDLAQALMDLGDIEQHASNRQDAEKSYLAGIAEIDRLKDEPSILLTRRRFERHLCSSLGDICSQRSDWAAAQPWMVRARDLAEALHQENPKNDDFLNSLLHAEAALGRCLLRIGEKQTALVHLRRSSELIRQYMALGHSADQGLELSGAVDALAITEMQTGQPEDAIGHFRQAIEISQAVHERDPQDLDAIVYLTNHHYNLHSALKTQQDLPGAVEAIASAEKFQTVYLKAVPSHVDEQFRLAQILTQESTLLVKLDRWADAAQAASRGLTNIATVAAEARLASQGGEHRDWYLAVLAESAWRTGALEEFRSHVEARIGHAATLTGDPLTRRRNTILRDLGSLPEQEMSEDPAMEWKNLQAALTAEAETRLSAK